MKFNHITFTIGNWFASAIINGDYTGLTGKEEQQLDNFLESETRGLPRGHWDGFGEEDSAGFATDEVTGVKGDCSTVRYYYPSPA